MCQLQIKMRVSVYLIISLFPFLSFLFLFRSCFVSGFSFYLVLVAKFRFWTLVAYFIFWTLVADLGFWIIVADVGFWIVVADFLYWRLVADFVFGH